jgi:alpha-glucosidase (family GH31 glycosyl hydrolase)
MAVIDSMKLMMQKKFTYNSTVKNPTKSLDANGKELTGEGVSIYYNNEPIVSTNLTYPQFVVRAGYLARKPQPSDGKTLTNQAEDVEFYRLEILYKKTMPKW